MSFNVSTPIFNKFTFLKMTQETKNKMAALIAEAKAKQLKANTIQVVTIPTPQDEDNTANNIKLLSEHIKNDMTEEEKKTQTLTLKSLKIIWHEGRHIEGATFENTTFESWAEIQKAFYILWDTNEKGEDGGYTKVKVCVSFNEIEATHTTRVDITNSIANGDFNPTQEHIYNFLKQSIDGIHEGKNYSFEAFESLELYTPTTDPAKQIIKEALKDIQPLPFPTIEELESTEQAKDDSINNVELSNLTIGELLGEKTEVKKIQVVDYSEKAFAVIGETKPIKDKLKELGGKFNPLLKCGAGWIFSKRNLEEVKNYLSKLNS